LAADGDGVYFLSFALSFLHFFGSFGSCCCGDGGGGGGRRYSSPVVLLILLCMGEGMIEEVEGDLFVNQGVWIAE
jgi:hypothetical protein